MNVSPGQPTMPTSPIRSACTGALRELCGPRASMRRAHSAWIQTGFHAERGSPAASSARARSSSSARSSAIGCAGSSSGSATCSSAKSTRASAGSPAGSRRQTAIGTAERVGC